MLYILTAKINVARVYFYDYILFALVIQSYHSVLSFVSNMIAFLKGPLFLIISNDPICIKGTIWVPINM